MSQIPNFATVDFADVTMPAPPPGAATLAHAGRHSGQAGL